MSRKLARFEQLVRFALILIGVFLLWLGVVWASLSASDYNEYLHPVCPAYYTYPCLPVTMTTVETFIVASALALSAGIISLVEGFQILRRNPITHVRTDSGVTH